MPSTLISNWTDYDAAAGTLLRLAVAHVCVVDDDLRRLRFEEHENATLLERFLSTDRQNTLCMVLANAAPLRDASPRLMRLIATFSTQMHAFRLAPGVVPETASLLLVDDRHTLVRFSNEQPRARLIIDDTAGSAPYAEQYARLLACGGEPMSATTLGL